MKKLLSIGAIGLDLVCSTSIGASADTTSSFMSAKTKALDAEGRTSTNLKEGDKLLVQLN